MKLEDIDWGEMIVQARAGNFGVLEALKLAHDESAKATSPATPTPPSPLIQLPGHVECPNCHHITLPSIGKSQSATASRCEHCGAVVDREGKIESVSK